MRTIVVKCYRCGADINLMRNGVHPKHRFYCQNPDCQQEMRTYRAQVRSEWKRRHKPKVDKSVYKRKYEKSAIPALEEQASKTRPKRLCRLCGKLIKGPNFFYCHSCHTRLTQIVDCDLLSEAGFTAGQSWTPSRHAF